VNGDYIIIHNVPCGFNGKIIKLQYLLMLKLALCNLITNLFKDNV